MGAINSSAVSLFTGPVVLTGNVGKVKVLYELYTRLAERENISILDIGCVGPSPLEFWVPLFERFKFQLTGVDVWGIDKAQNVVAQRGWQDQVTLRKASGYDLTDMFKPETFDIVVATQVLEHVAQIDRFMLQVATVLRKGGVAYLVLDSAHWQKRFDYHDPGRLVKNITKKILSSLGNERHYDLPWADYEVEASCRRAGLQVIECRYHNLAGLKQLHNACMPSDKKNALMQKWFDIEEYLNQEERVRTLGRHEFLGIYFCLQKPEPAATL